MPQFQPISPIIIDLYLHILHLNDMGDTIDGYAVRNSEVPLELKTQLNTSASEFLSIEARVLERLESKRVVDQQLAWFHERRGIA